MNSHDNLDVMDKPVTKYQSVIEEEIYAEYKLESKEILARMRTECGKLKKRSDHRALTELQECSHKIRGVAGMMDYSHIEELAEKTESISKLLLEGKLRLNQEIVAVLLASMNLLTKYIETDYHERYRIAGKA